MALLQSEMNILKTGDYAPEFSLKNVQTGENVSLKEFTGKPVAVIFMCNHCPYVIAKMLEIKDLQDEFADTIPLLLINPNNNEYYPDDSFAKSTKLAEKFGYTNYLYDETQEVAKDYGAVCTPDPFLFDKDHKLVYHGRINDAMNPNDEPTSHELREALLALKEGKPIKKDFVPSQGCSIKWQ